jgi:hypothetical protein
VGESGEKRTWWLRGGFYRRRGRQEDLSLPTSDVAASTRGRRGDKAAWEVIEAGVREVEVAGSSRGDDASHEVSTRFDALERASVRARVGLARVLGGRGC